ncbi:hypothetical protein [Morganella morganii]|nr:hypothetical protein [Morganella morganii]WLV41038.1 hypothetical protein M2O45_11515 [Morganella morganii]
MLSPAYTTHFSQQSVVKS